MVLVNFFKNISDLFYLEWDKTTGKIREVSKEIMFCLISLVSPLTKYKVVPTKYKLGKFFPGEEKQHTATY